MNNDFNTRDLQFVNRTKSDTSTIAGLAEARSKNRLNQQIWANDYKQELQDIELLIKRVDELGSKKEKYQNIINDLKEQENKMNNQINSKTVDTEDAYKSMIKIKQDELKLEQSITVEKIKQLQAEHAKAKTKKDKDRISSEIEKARTNLSEMSSDFEEIISRYNEMAEVNKQSQKKMLDVVSENLSKLKQEAQSLAVVKGLGNIQNALGVNQTQLINNVTSQFGISRGDFEALKKDLIKKLDDNGQIAKFAWKDTAEYLSNLDKLGITTTQMAEEQYMAVMAGTRYLGQSVETQAAILKNARKSGNMNLLNETNQTIVKILNSQLGVSKAQLDQATLQSASLSNLAMLGGSRDATSSFTKQLSAVTSKYGEGASTALSNIATSMLNGDTSYAAYLGTDYQRIMKLLQSGDDSALIELYKALQNSNYAKTQSSNAYLRGDMNNDMMTIMSSGSQNSKSLEELMADINASDGDVLDYISDIKTTIDELVGNTLSNIAAYFLPSWFDLNDAATLASIAYYTVSFPLEMAKLRAAISSGTLTEELLDTKFGKLLKLFGANGEAGSLLGAVSSMAGVLAIIAGAVMMVSDGIAGANKADEWGTSKGSAAIGGALGGTASGMEGLGKGFLKGALIGGGIGLVFGGPFGGVVGAVIGGIIGASLGYAGGERIANFLDGNGLTKNNKAEGDESHGSILSTIPNAGDESGKYSANWAWKVTSPFGPRRSLNTNNGGKTASTHSGIDLGSGYGKGIGSNSSGKVYWSGYDKSGGNMTIIKSDNGYYERYCHMIDPALVRSGERVSAGQLIGYTGDTGGVTGPHLHFGVSTGTGSSTAVDPSQYISSSLFAQRNNLYGKEPVDSVPTDATNENSGTMLLSNIISADTLNDAAKSTLNYAGDETTEAVNTGFTNLIDKLDSMSHRQDQQEEMLKAISSGTTSALYRF